MFYKKKPTIAIFCGSQKGNKTIYSSQSKKVARILCKNSYPIIYGGGIASIKHIDAVISGNHASGVALASYLHVDGKSISDIKSSLELSGHLMRQDITL